VPLPPADEVHLWALDLSRSPGEVGGLLPSRDLRRADELGPRWVVARASLRALLGGYLGAEPQSLGFRERGKPRLEPVSPLRFNLSHSGDVALVAVSTEREVGVDVEPVKQGRDVERLSRRALLASERAAVHEADDQALAFHRYWVAKEAFVKATGRGIESLRSFEVVLEAPGGARLNHVAGDPAEAAKWTLAPLDAGPRFAAAAVVAAPGARIHQPVPFDP
jgi:4'-phosphopantetheinyl transferase